MELFNIGVPELGLIIAIALLFLGPKGTVATFRKIGQLAHSLVKSPIWKEIKETTREIREIPQKIVSEAGIGEEIREIQEATGYPFPEGSGPDKTAKPV